MSKLTSSMTENSGIMHGANNLMLEEGNDFVSWEGNIEICQTPLHILPLQISNDVYCKIKRENKFLHAKIQKKLELANIRVV